jgi:hypothetical protein
MPIALSFLMALYLVALARFEAIAGDIDEGLLAMIGMAFMRTAIAYAVLLMFAHWHYWRQRVSKRPLMRLGYAVIGLLSTAVATLYEVFKVTDGPFDLTLGVIAIVLWWRGASMFEALAETIPLRDRDVRMMFPIYPPVERLDLVRFDAVIVLVLLLPVLVSFMP